MEKGYIVHDAGEAVLVDTAYNADMMLKSSRPAVCAC